MFARLVVLVGLWCAAGALAQSRLVITSVENDRFYEVNPSSAAVSLVGNLGVMPGYMASLAWDAGSGTLYGTTTGTDNLYRINPATAQTTLVGPLGVPVMHGLAFNPADGWLYGVDSTTNSNLYRISPSTGAATLIGATGVLGLNGLTFDPAGRLLASLAYATPDGALYEVNLHTGAGTFIASTVRLTSIAFQPETGDLYGMNNGAFQGASWLYRINATTGAYQSVGLFPTITNSLGMEFIPAPGAPALLALASLAAARRRRR